MNANVQTNKKAELLSRTVEHVAIDQYDARPVIDAMRQMSFTSRDTRVRPTSCRWRSRTRTARPG